MVTHHPWSRFVLTLAAALLGLLGAPDAQAQVTARVTADNAYMIGYGSATAITWLPAVENATAGEIFNCAGGPETYTFNPGVNDVIYVAAYSDDAVTQGVLGEFSLAGGRTVRTGDPAWQVAAIGKDLDPVPGPGSAVTAAIVNAVMPPTWVGQGTPGLAVGEVNTPGGIFPQVCPSLIAPATRWMWYASQANVNPFNQNPPGGGGHREFLIFRLPVRALMCRCVGVPGVPGGAGGTVVVDTAAAEVSPPRPD